jgi:hypothetical protein
MELIIIIDGRTVAPRYENEMWRVDLDGVHFISQTLDQLIVGLRQFHGGVLMDAANRSE